MSRPAVRGSVESCVCFAGMHQSKHYTEIRNSAAGEALHLINTWKQVEDTGMAMKHFEQIRKQELPPMDTGEIRAFLKDFSVSEDPDKPITCGLFRLEQGKSLTYTYTYHEMKLIVDGTFHLEDETGQKITATAGDLFYFPKGSTITFSTPKFGLGFFCGQRGEGEA